MQSDVLKDRHKLPQCVLASVTPGFLSFWSAEKKRKEKTTPFGVNLMRSQVLYRAAQAFGLHNCPGMLHACFN